MEVPCKLWEPYTIKQEVMRYMPRREQKDGDGRRWMKKSAMSLLRVVLGVLVVYTRQERQDRDWIQRQGG
ncbi:hypothetical protein VFPPC_16158 [Pochonia chlamydosporia 170]|uniref:Uncharacterized protein n=1 Tax=Pochonia chlamydosporia 170 TaxID=1380566 RepID=A0A179FFB7_METCM|nr:hypothetical protein VFPPC_16158 [Pochonia chlamydosporia 170]OAQ64097.1 hypothetical protein VFPPC_16158 [Pochonia chlamydosporia 170]